MTDPRDTFYMPQPIQDLIKRMTADGVDNGFGPNHPPTCVPGRVTRGTPADFTDACIYLFAAGWKYRDEQWSLSENDFVWGEERCVRNGNTRIAFGMCVVMSLQLSRETRAAFDRGRDAAAELVESYGPVFERASHVANAIRAIQEAD